MPHYLHFMFALVLLVSFFSQPFEAKEHEGYLKQLFNDLVKKDDTLVLIHEKKNEECFPLLRDTNPHLIVNFEKETQLGLEDSFKFVICANSNKWLKYLLHKLSSSSIWNPSSGPRSQYFIVSKESNVTEMRKILWNHQITKAILLQRINNTNNSKIINRRHRFFKPTRQAPYKYTVIYHLVKIPSIRRIVFTTFEWRFIKSDSYFKNIHEVVVEIEKIIGEVLNVAVKLDYGDICKPKDTNDRQICLAVLPMNEFFIQKHRESSRPCFMDTVTWIIPRIQKENNQSMIFVFKWTSSIALLIVFLVMVLISWLFSRFLREYSGFQYIQIWILLVAQLMVSVSSNIFPRSVSLRILFIFYMFYCLQISNYYQAQMTSVLVDPPTEPEIESLRSLLESPIPLYVVRHHLEDIKTHYQDIFEKIKHKMITKPVFVNTSHRLGFCAERGCALIMNTHSLTHRMQQFLPKFYYLKFENFGSSYQSYFIKRGHYFLEKLNHIQRAIFDSGIYEKIMADIKDKHRPKPPEDSDVGQNIYLRLQHLKEVFALLLIGLSIATVVLFGEILVKYCYFRS